MLEKEKDTKVCVGPWAGTEKGTVLRYVWARTQRVQRYVCVGRDWHGYCGMCG